MTIQNRVETAVSKIEDSSDIAEKFADVSRTVEFDTPKGPVKPIGQLQQEADAAIARIAHFTEETWVAGQTYTEKKIYFIHNGIAYNPVVIPYTAGLTDIQADIDAGLFTVLQGLTIGDLSTRGNAPVSASSVEIAFSVLMPVIDGGQLDNAVEGDLILGQKVKTLGYFSVNDGGGAEYVVATDGEVDNGRCVLLGNGLKLLLVQSGSYIDIGVFGAYGPDHGGVAVRKCLEYADANGLIAVGSRPLKLTSWVGGLNNQPFLETGSFKLSTGQGIASVKRFIDKPNHHKRSEFEGDGSTSDYNTIGHLSSVRNTGSGGYGHRIGFHQLVDVDGFAIGQGIVSKNDGNGQALAQWLVQSSSESPTANGGTFGMEINVINVTRDDGYSKRRGLLNSWSGGIQFVPEARDLTRLGSTDCYNVTYGFAVTHSSKHASSGKAAKTYNGFLIERGAIAEGGVGVQIAGTDETDDSQYGDGETSEVPNIGLRIEQKWNKGIDLTEGIFNDDNAINLAETHKINFGGVKVLGSQQDAVADAVDSASVVTQFNKLLQKLRNHGLIKT